MTDVILRSLRFQQTRLIAILGLALQVNALLPTHYYSSQLVPSQQQQFRSSFPTPALLV